MNTHPHLVDRLAVMNRSLRQLEFALAPARITQREADDLGRLADQPNLGLNELERYTIAARLAPNFVPQPESTVLDRPEARRALELAYRGLVRITFRVGPHGYDYVTTAEISPSGHDCLAERLLAHLVGR